MEKIYRANLEYNIRKKRNSLILVILLFFSMLGLISVFVALKSFAIVVSLGAFLFLPIIILPSIFINYPTDNRAILTLTDKSITVNKETFKLKDVYKFRVIISLPASKIDSENIETLSKLRDVKPSHEFMGNLDIVVKDYKKNKKKVVYTTIDNVIDATENLLLLGIKNYEIKYSIKKNTMKCEYDLYREVMFNRAKDKTELNKQEKELTEKEKIKQLL